MTRPGGQVYRPRVLAGMADVEALRTLRAEGVPSLLAGPPGTGKTSLVEAAFPDLITVAGDGDTTVGDFVGEYTQKPDGTYEFIYGPLIRAMQEGRVLFIDDATLISPAVLAVCYPALDGRREVTVKAHKGETITAADGFYVVAGHNPGVHGAVLTEALSSRFTFQFDVATDFDLARSLGIDSRAITAARNLATRQANGETGWAPQLRELLAFAKVTKIFGLDTALANLAGVAPAEDRDVVADTLAKTFGKPSPRCHSAARSNPAPCPGKERRDERDPARPRPREPPPPLCRLAGLFRPDDRAGCPGRRSRRPDRDRRSRGGPGSARLLRARPAPRSRSTATTCPSTRPPPTRPTRPTASATPPCGARPSTSAPTPRTPAGAPPRALMPPGRRRPPRWRSPASRPARLPAGPVTGPGCAPAPARSSSATSPPPLPRPRARPRPGRPPR